MADEKDFAKELNALIKRYVDGGATLLTNCYEKQIACSGTTTSKSIWKPSLLPGVKPSGASHLALAARSLSLRMDGSEITTGN